MKIIIRLLPWIMMSYSFLIHAADVDSIRDAYLSFKNMPIENSPVQVTLLEAAKKWSPNAGIFRIEDGDNIIIAKALCPQDPEGQQEINDFEALLNGDKISFYARLSEYGFPTVAKYLGTLKNVGKGGFNIVLFEKASGINLDRFAFNVLNESQEIIQEHFFGVGQALGKFYAHESQIHIGEELCVKGWTHGDPHPANIFYEPNTRLVTFIDYSTIKYCAGRKYINSEVSNPLFSNLLLIPNLMVKNLDFDYGQLKTSLTPEQKIELIDKAGVMIYALFDGFLEEFDRYIELQSFSFNKNPDNLKSEHKKTILIASLLEDMHERILQIEENSQTGYHKLSYRAAEDLALAKKELREVASFYLSH